jgi:hypothetical protein
VRRKIDHWQIRGAEVGAGQKRWESRMTGFRGGERAERGAGHGLLLGNSREVAVDRDVDEEGVGEQHEGEMAVPAEVAAVG